VTTRRQGGELRRAYVPIWAEAIEAADFRRSILGTEGFVIEALAKRGARPARFRKAGGQPADQVEEGAP